MELLFLLILVLIMAGALGSGYPVAFALPGAAILSIGLAAISGYLFADNPDAYFHTGGPREWLTSGVTNLRGLYWEVERDTLIAIPLFIFMGIMLQRSKIAEDLLMVMAQLFGPVPGGLGISVVFVGALLAATTGIVGATVVAMGMISLPAMMKNKYSNSLASGTIAASGTLGQIIPPSIVLIILADQLASASDQASSLRKSLHKEATGEISMPSAFDVTATSAGEMFMGALVPGLILVGLYMLFILVFALLRPKLAPAIPYEGVKDRWFWGRVFFALVPPLALIFLVLGSIISGVATVNQAGAIGAAGALIMAGYRLSDSAKGTYTPVLMALAAIALYAVALNNFDMNIKALNATGGDRTGIYIGVFATILLAISLIWSAVRVFHIENTLYEVMRETAKSTSLVFVILMGAAMLTAAFRAFGGEDIVRDFLNDLPGGFWAQFIIVMAVIFVLGFFLDFIEIAVVVVPIVAPILLSDPSANITAVWLGVMIGLNIQTSFLTPPFGFALFYLRAVAPKTVKTTQIYKGVVPFIALQLAALGIVGSYPQLVNYLPNRLSFLSEKAPPPRNPKLQQCLDTYVSDLVLSGEVDLLGATETMQRLDMSALPPKWRDDMNEGFAKTQDAYDLLSVIRTSSEAVSIAAPDYTPVQREVRRIEKEMRHLADLAKGLKLDASRLRDEAQASKRDALLERADKLTAEAAALEKEIPANWDDLYGTFSKLVKSENVSRTSYRRTADQAYEPGHELLTLLQENQQFLALEKQMASLATRTNNFADEAAKDTVTKLMSEFSAVAGGSEMRRALQNVEKALKRGKTQDALAKYEDAAKLYQETAQWRAQAEIMVPDLESYVGTMSATLGLRQQDKLNREQALFLAGCQSHHRDVSVNF
jgi:tripartite ATP-independent transporter DctM subunit